MYTWSLNELYTGYDETYNNDINKLDAIIDQMGTHANNLKTQEDLEKWLQLDTDFNTLGNSLYAYAYLNLTTDTTDPTSNSMYNKLQGMISRLSRPQAQFKKFLIAHKDDFPTWKANSTLINEHAFILEEVLAQADYLLGEDVEDAITKMQMNASENWSKLQGHLTSLTTTTLNGEKHTLASIRNLAYSADQTVRKEAYEKELELYTKMEEAVSFSLNSIKGEVNTINDLRGYKTPIEATLVDSRMSQQTLDALLGAIEKYLPVMRKYLKHKATLFGHKNGLPWYDLFAPFETENPKTYTVKESREMIVDSFAHFSDDLSNLAKRAYDEHWIDFLPHEGKRGGAFCSNLPQIKQSRVLTNFDGSISDIITIAHELGHAYHGHMIEDLSILNTDYSMPVAETASTFCENIVLNAALKTASHDEQMILIENSISDLVQITVDIYSRYQFEKEVFDRRRHEFMFSNDLKEIMLQAQRNTYGDGLDPEVMHPYMWICKGHYYSAGRSFYNFPYAFGGLFALGLYGKFEAEGEAFVPQYRDLLKATTTATCEDVAKMANIDVTDQAFWESSLEVVAKRIDQYIELSK